MTAYALRNRGQSDVIAADKAAHREYANLVREALDALILLNVNGGTFTADDIRDRAATCALADDLPFDPAPNLIPAVIGGYAAAGRIERVGDYHSARRSRRYSRNAIWRAS